MMKKFLSFIAIAAVAAVAFISCEEKPEVPADIALKGITVSPATYSLAVGETKALTVAYDPEDATIKPEVEWTSSKPEVATVDGRGTVTGVAAGTADIVAKAGEFTAKCVVTVVGEPGPGPEPEDNWDYTPSAEYLAATNNLWKPIFDGNFDFLNGQITHYTAMDITAIEALKKDQSTYRLTFDDATSGEWGNCNFLTTQVDHFIPMTAGAKYTIKVTLGATADISNVIFSLHEYKADDPDQKYEGAWLLDLFGPVTANTPTTFEAEYTAQKDIENIAFTIIPQNGTPAGMMFYIKDLIILEEKPTNVVPEVFAGTYKVSKIMVLGAVGSTGFVDAKDKSWMWNSSVNKEYDNLLVLSSTDNTADYQAGADGAYWDYILVADKNKLGTGDMDLSHNFGQLPHGVVPCNINTENGLVTLNNSITAQGLTAGTYPFAVDWASAAASVTVPEGCIALAFQCKVMPDGDYTWDDSWANSDFDRFAIHPFYCVMIFAKQ